MKMKQMRKLLSISISILMLIVMLPVGAAAADLVASGECGAMGDNLTWTLDSNGVLTISGTGDMAMYGQNDSPWAWNDLINRVVINPGVTSIGSNAFYDCINISSVVIPNSVASIGSYAFCACYGLSSIAIPEGVMSIGEYSFFQCTGLTGSLVLPNSLAYINDSAFVNCTGLTSVTIPGGVDYIGDSAFFDCFSLTSVYINEGVTTVGESAFSQCSDLTTIVIPESVTSIERFAFEGCSGLTSLELPWNVLYIGEGICADCSKLVKINVDQDNSRYCSIDGVVYSKDETKLVLYPAGKTGSYVIPDSVSSISSRAFESCSGLTEVTIPEGVETIAANAFLRCSGLESVSIPYSVAVIANSAFSGCSSLVDVNYGGTESQWGRVRIEDKNEPLLNAAVHYSSDTGAETPETVENTEHTLPTATQYVPYSGSIPAVKEGSKFTQASGKLPEGLSLSAEGELSGFPMELGVFDFKVTETYEGGSTEHKCSLSVYSRVYADVEENNVPGYGFVETAGDDGRIDNQVVTSVKELTDQVMHCEGAFSEFQDLYIDARKLVRGVEYYAEEGSTRIVVLGQTIGGEGGGTHTVAAEFEKSDGEKVYTVQNYYVAGIASREVHVTVYGETVIWTDAEPYIDTNNRTMTPFRVVGDALGLEISWDSAAREAVFSNGSKTIYFPIGSSTARTSEGRTIQMDTSAVIVNGRTYAPVRYLAEYFGYSVDWDGKSRTVIIR